MKRRGVAEKNSKWKEVEAGREREGKKRKVETEIERERKWI